MNFASGDVWTPGTPPETFPTQLTLSVWACFSTPDQTLSFEGINAEFVASFSLNARQFAFAAAGFNKTFSVADPVLCPAPVHVLFSIDFAALTASIYWLDAPGVEDAGGVWFGHGGLDHMEDGGWAVTNPAGAADIWLDARYVDFSVTANRRKFINADRTPAALGSTGQTPFGVAPRHFLHLADGAPAADFATNRGTAGAWEATDTPLVADTNCALSAATSPDPRVFLSWSDDRGHSFGNPVAQSMGGPGGYLTQPQWQRLGMGRDRVFRLEWSAPVKTVLQGAWIDLHPGQS